MYIYIVISSFYIVIYIQRGDKPVECTANNREYLWNIIRQCLTVSQVVRLYYIPLNIVLETNDDDNNNNDFPLLFNTFSLLSLVSSSSSQNLFNLVHSIQSTATMKEVIVGIEINLDNKASIMSICECRNLFFIHINSKIKINNFYKIRLNSRKCIQSRGN